MNRLPDISRAVFAGACLAMAAGAASAACRAIRFDPGATSATVQGSAPAEGVECLRFGAGNGQTVQLSVKSPHDQVAFSIDGVTDNRDQFSFKSRKQNYDVLMHQTMKAVAPVRYELTLSIR